MIITEQPILGKLVIWLKQGQHVTFTSSVWYNGTIKLHTYITESCERIYWIYIAGILDEYKRT